MKNSSIRSVVLGALLAGVALATPFQQQQSSSTDDNQRNATHSSSTKANDGYETLYETSMSYSTTTLSSSTSVPAGWVQVNNDTMTQPVRDGYQSYNASSSSFSRQNSTSYETTVTVMTTEWFTVTEGAPSTAGGTGGAPPAGATSVSTSGDVRTGAYSGTGTWYDVPSTAGTCGTTNNSNQNVCQISAALFNSMGASNASNGSCGKQIQAFYGASAVTCTVVGVCQSCSGEYDVNFSPSAFNQLAAQGVGTIPITWSWA